MKYSLYSNTYKINLRAKLLPEISKNGLDPVKNMGSVSTMLRLAYVLSASS